MRPPSAFLSTLLVATALLGACSSGGQSKDGAGLKDAAKSSAEAYYRGDAKAAYRSFSKACRDDVTYSEFAATVKVASAMYEGFSGLKLSDLKVKTVSVKNVNNGGGEASVALEAKGNEDLNLGVDEFHPWVYEDGAWKQSDCSQMTFDQ